jgi:hypothetical protein
MAAADEIVTEAAGAGGRLALQFERRGDRWSQRIDCLHSTQRWPCLESVDTSGLDQAKGGVTSDSTNQGWPLSPPLQQLLIEDRGAAGRVALMVGMAGRSHWSMSVEPVAGRAAFRFDVACRVQAVPGWLGSCWRLGTASESAKTAGFSLSLPGRVLTANLNLGELTIELVEVASQPAGEVGYELAAHNDSNGGELSSLGQLAVRLGPGTFPRTARWIYTIEHRD